MTFSSCSKRRRRGFTLIEVMLVMAILVIIASYAAYNYIAVQNQAKINQAKVQIQAFKGPLLLFRLQMGDFPAGLDALLQPMEDHTGRVSGGSWIESLPLDPWRMQYMYEYPSRHGLDMPDIWSNGPDGTPNTQDDIGNWQEQ